MSKIIFIFILAVFFLSIGCSGDYHGEPYFPNYDSDTILPAEKIDTLKIQRFYSQNNSESDGGRISFMKKDSVRYDNYEPSFHQSFNGTWSAQNDTLFLNFTEFQENVLLPKINKINAVWKFVLVNKNLYQIYNSKREKRPFLPLK